MDTVRFHGTLTGRLVEELGEKLFHRAFDEIARFELSAGHERYRTLLLRGEAHLLEERERRFVMPGQQQILRTLCRNSEDRPYRTAYHAVVEEVVTGKTLAEKVERLTRSLTATRALEGDPNSNFPSPPEHEPLYWFKADLASTGFPPR